MAVISKKIIVAGFSQDPATKKVDVKLLFHKQYIDEFELPDEVRRFLKLQGNLEMMVRASYCSRLRSTFPRA